MVEWVDRNFCYKISMKLADTVRTHTLTKSTSPLAQLSGSIGWGQGHLLQRVHVLSPSLQVAFLSSQLFHIRLGLLHGLWHTHRGLLIGRHLSSLLFLLVPDVGTQINMPIASLLLISFIFFPCIWGEFVVVSWITMTLWPLTMKTWKQHKVIWLLYFLSMHSWATRMTLSFDRDLGQPSPRPFTCVIRYNYICFSNSQLAGGHTYGSDPLLYEWCLQVSFTPWHTHRCVNVQVGFFFSGSLLTN